MLDNSPTSRLPVLGVVGGLLLCLAGSPAAFAQGAAGSDVEACKSCHASAYEAFQASVHGQKGNLRGPARAGGCASCHGDGTEHVKAGGGRGVGGIKNPGSKMMDADQKDATCLKCHAGGSKRMQWAGSTHQSRGTACTNCHTMHAKDRALTKLTQPQVCFTCHKQQRVEVNRMFRHPIPEGKVACSDCHNPHGSIGRALMKRDSVVETCYQCHAEKRGPFVHPHDPVTEDCALCHNPHGTVADSMLKVRPPFLCHQCHTPHGGFIAQARGQRGQTATLTGKSGVNVTQARSCMNCHTQVHGSNNPSRTNPTPQVMLR